MFQRISKVKSFTTQTVLFGAVIQIGDSSYIDGTSYALAIQRRSDIIYDYEPQFTDYQVFAHPTVFPIIDEPIQIRFENPCPFIDVGHIDLIGASTASVASVGQVGHIRMKSRIKHIRQLATPTEAPQIF